VFCIHHSEPRSIETIQNRRLIENTSTYEYCLSGDEGWDHSWLTIDELEPLRVFESVDDLIHKNPRRDCYARFVLHYYRLNIALQEDFGDFMKPMKLYCSYRDPSGTSARYRVDGATETEIFLIKYSWQNHTEEGAAFFVPFGHCHNWSPKP